VTATFVVNATRLDGEAATGQVNIQTLVSGASVEEIRHADLGVKVASQTLPLVDGGLSLELVPTDDTGWSPSPRQYQVQLMLDTGYLPAKVFDLPDGEIVKYSDL
jgi:hypothetical protein